MGPVALHVADLDAMTSYYRDVLTLEVLSAVGDTVTLGRAGVPLVVLRHGPRLAAASPGHAGLFHTALLFESPTALAGALATVARRGAGTYTGSADHLVSQAFYLTDPEGNGVELYVDRPREAWSWRDGQVEMASLPLDATGFIRRHLTPEAEARPEASGAVVGHVHLQVGDIATARAFYVDTLGFEATFEMPTALFVSAGGYHHHMAMNTWRSAGAARRPVTLGLGEVTIDLPTPDDVGLLAERLRRRGLAVRDEGASLAVDDPWANLVRVRVAGASAA
ncbi:MULTISPECIES: VOC family protein [unclassified Actinotalea]|uniref:VOC family protein n=1 Tax=unclassified Actinotalea TaxID=2638618 RepID=UPI0015F5CF28|nr:MULTISPECIES: VOC family protein [unclassified Actinotalea]